MRTLWTDGSLCAGVTPLLHFLQECILVNEQGSKEVAFAHGFSVKGKIKKIKTYWEMLQQVGQLHGYFPKLSKFYLIVKEKHLENAVETFRESLSQNYKRRKRISRRSTWKRGLYTKLLVDERAEQRGS